METKYDINYYESKKYFSGKYSDNEESVVWAGRFRDIISRGVHGNLLDIGTAYGFFLKACESSFKTFGCDISSYAASRARRNSPKSQIIICDASKGLPYKDNTFDVVTMFDAIEHIDKYDELLYDAYRVMKPEGLLVLTTPNRWSIDSILFGKNYWYKRDTTHKMIFSKSRLKETLLRSGFIDVNIYTVELLHFLIDIFHRFSNGKKMDKQISKKNINSSVSNLKKIFSLIHSAPSPFGANLYTFCRKPA